jgi:hypothetical protein
MAHSSDVPVNKHHWNSEKWKYCVNSHELNLHVKKRAYSRSIFWQLWSTFFLWKALVPFVFYLLLYVIIIIAIVEIIFLLFQFFSDFLSNSGSQKLGKWILFFIYICLRFFEILLLLAFWKHSIWQIQRLFDLLHHIRSLATWIRSFWDKFFHCETW